MPISIAVNPLHQEKTKHGEVNCHFIRDKVSQGAIKPTYIFTHDQLAAILTKRSSCGQTPSHSTQVALQKLEHYRNKLWQQKFELLIDSNIYYFFVTYYKVTFLTLIFQQIKATYF